MQDLALTGVLATNSAPDFLETARESKLLIRLLNKRRFLPISG